MKTRRLGKTGIEVSEIGFGAFQLGNAAWGTMTDQDAQKLVHQALALGCTLFDTAPNYGKGNSERLLGEALQGKRQDVTLVSKFGHRVDGGHDFTAAGLIQSLEGSLQRLKTDCIDVLLIHSPPMDVLRAEHEVWTALRDVQQQGKIRFFGASVDYAAEVDEVLRGSEPQVLELLFNMLHQDVSRSFATIAEQEVGVLTKVPLDSGWLSGHYTADTRFHDIRSRWSEQDIARRAQCVTAVKALLGEREPLAQQALAFLLSYEQISCVIPGIRTEQQLHSACLAAGKRLPTEVVAELEQLWLTITDQGQNLLPW